MGCPQIVILGAGPTGVGAAYWLAQRGLARVTVLEQRNTVGGNAGSFELDGMRVDYGSHRLHPSCDPGILQELRALLGPDLVDRPRHGRIRLQGRWIHFPLRPLDLAFSLPPRFFVGAILDTLGKLLPRQRLDGENFASVLERGLGRTMCHEFYFPYARKIWGLEPDQMSATQARRRVGANSPLKLLARVLSAVPLPGRPRAGRFFYPKQGYGQISEELYEAGKQAGAEFLFSARVVGIEREGSRAKAVTYERNGRTERLEAHQIWSTLPLSAVVKGIRPGPPTDVIEAASAISYRGMVLIYLSVEQSRFTEYDAHYFPEESIPVSRLSEPKNYAGVTEPHGRTVLCAELPCDVESAYWKMTDNELGKLVRESLEKAALPLEGGIRTIATRRLKNAYPIYSLGYEAVFAKLDAWLAEIDGLITFGRQGLFVHDNTHHALYMAYAASKCLDRSCNFDGQQWRSYRKIFETHVVED